MEDEALLKAKREVCGSVSWTLLAVALAFSALGTAMVFMHQSMYQRMFSDMKVDIPIVTAICFQSWVRWVLPVLAVAAVVKELVIGNKRVTLQVNLVHIAVIIVMYEVFREAMVQPLVKMMQGMAG